ncbi:TMEM175 family protein [Gelidibacter japonicus]|uniref:TMEM175 family protein n=1 Tax=Gelidibacter japonicus TaxID=1962232 RepID=UPI002022194C|nr:TMEM175 family protein [Gelidibacter japonicus]MCL8006616.1 TMEM175 family protein [Gelidibacter japonicus]
MKTGRLEAFSDGVLAIIITIMVLGMSAPEGYSFEDLKPILPVFLTYVLSFIYVGIYWNNHHHLLQAVNKVNGKILWANLNLLFWLSLFPFATDWMGKNHFEDNPTAIYGIVLLMTALAFKILVYCVIQNEGNESNIGKVYSKDKKLNLSPLLYLIGVVSSFFLPIVSLTIYLGVALMWIIPDRRIEKTIKD